MNSLQHQPVFAEKQSTPAVQKETGLLPQQGQSFPFKEKIDALQRRLVHFLGLIKSIGFSTSMTNYDRRKLEIFNVLNFLNLIAGVLVPVTGLIQDRNLPATAWVAAFGPPMISVCWYFF
ncbi:MAG: hypothetical protein WDO19_00435 [Bacteroidota bacterium]